MNENIVIKKEDNIQENIEIKVEEKMIEKKENEKSSFEVKLIGWVGTIILIVAYSLNSLGYLETKNIIYPILNLLAATLLAVRVYSDKNWSNLFLETFWGAIAVVSIIKYFTF